jgi:CRP/FNR family transcriptional regulator
MRDLLTNNNYGFVFEDHLIDEIATLATLVEFKEGDVLIDFGYYIKKYLY